MIPGITVFPARSIVRAPAGTVTEAAGPTAAIFSPRITIVCPSFTGAPVPSMTRAFVSATTGSLTVTYGLRGAARSRAWAPNGAAARTNAVRKRMAECIGVGIM